MLRLRVSLAVPQVYEVAATPSALSEDEGDYEAAKFISNGSVTISDPPPVSARTSRDVSIRQTNNITPSQAISS